MAWCTDLHNDEELVLDDRIILRKVKGKLQFVELPGTARMSIVKRASTAPAAP